ncbi:MAG: glycosyltransferase [Verrucomicrobiota bacterium]
MTGNQDSSGVATKVALLTHCLDRSAGGLYFSVPALGRALSRNDGCKISVFAPGSYTEQTMEHWRPLQTLAHPVRGPKDYLFAPGMEKSLRRFSPQVIHLNGIWTYNSRVVNKLSNRYRIPFIISPRGMLSDWALTVSAWKKWIMGNLHEKRFLKTASCMHALNQQEARQFRKYGLEQPICVIPNGVDLPVIDSATQGSRDGIQRILYIGRFHRIKGLTSLIRAYSDIWRTNPGFRKKWRLVLAGFDDGGHLEDCQELARNKECYDGIEWPGTVYGEDKTALINQCQWFILPSHSEAMPMAVLEAFSYGLPAILSRYCNLQDAFNANAAICGNPEEDSMKAALLKAAAMPETERKAMGGAARKLVESKYTWDKQGLAMFEVYEWLLNRRERPSCVVLD